MITYVTSAEQPTVGGLVLQVERPILGIGQLVINIVAAE